MECRICGNSRGNAGFKAREMYCGFRDVHPYFECANCGCVQIAEPPADLAKYYPASYYSYKPVAMSSGLRGLLVRQRDRYAALGRGTLGKALNARFPVPQFNFLKPLVGELSLDSRILDVGCGVGKLVQKLHAAGFGNVLGIDPFIEHDLDYGKGLRVLKKAVADMQGEHDLIVYCHSFEHIWDADGTLRKTYELLRPGGCCTIAVPTVSSYAWKHYGADWVQLDAPRHFYLHSRTSMELLARQAGFDLFNTVYDSFAFQFWASEQYARDIALVDERSYDVNPGKSMFTADDIAAFTARANELNAAGQGDQAVFYLRRPLNRTSSAAPS